MWENTPEETIAALKSGEVPHIQEDYVAGIHSSILYWAEMEMFQVELHVFVPTADGGHDCEVMMSNPFATEEEAVEYLKSFRQAHERTMAMAALLEGIMGGRQDPDAL